MSISLTPDQERFVQAKLEAGKYRSAEEILELALRLLEEFERCEAEWIEEVRRKVDAAIAVSNQTSPLDGETFVNSIVERFQRTEQA